MPDAYDEDDDKLLGKSARDKRMQVLNKRYEEEAVTMTE